MAISFYGGFSCVLCVCPGPTPDFKKQAVVDMLRLPIMENVCKINVRWTPRGWLAFRGEAVHHMTIVCGFRVCRCALCVVQVWEDRPENVTAMESAVADSPHISMTCMMPPPAGSSAARGQQESPLEQALHALGLASTPARRTTVFSCLQYLAAAWRTVSGATSLGGDAPASKAGHLSQAQWYSHYHCLPFGSFGFGRCPAGGDVDVCLVAAAPSRGSSTVKLSSPLECANALSNWLTSRNGIAGEPTVYTYVGASQRYCPPPPPLCFCFLFCPCMRVRVW